MRGLETGKKSRAGSFVSAAAHRRSLRIPSGSNEATWCTPRQRIKHTRHCALTHTQTHSRKSKEKQTKLAEHPKSIIPKDFLFQSHIAYL